MRARFVLVAVLLLAVGASPLAGRPHDRGQRACRRACGNAVRSCMTASGKGLRACKAEVRFRCAREGLPVCSPALLPLPRGSCSESAPACGGSCPFAEFGCVPNGGGGCNCEAAACGRARSCSLGVCSDSWRVCVLRAGRCKCV